MTRGSIAPCQVPWLERDHPLWSHSGRCRNYQYVQTEVNSINNWFSLWQAVGALCLLPICGKLADVYGRRPVFNWTTVMPCIAFLIFLVDSIVGVGNGMIYFAGILLTVFLTHGPIGWSMTIDLIKDPIDQERFFPIMNAIQGGSISAICGDVLAYAVLMLHLEDYTRLWALLSAVAGAILVFIWLLMPETMPNPKRWQGWRVLVRDILPLGCGGNAAAAAGGGGCIEDDINQNQNHRSGSGSTGSLAAADAAAASEISSSKVQQAQEATGSSSSSEAEPEAEPPSYLHAFTLWCKLPPAPPDDTAAGNGGGGDQPHPHQASALQLSQLRVLQVSLFAVVVWSFQGGVNMFDSTFLLGPLHFLQEERISIQIFGKGQKRHFLRHLCKKMYHFTKTGSGQT